MDLELTAEQEAVRKGARDFAEREIAPQAAKWDREGRFPHEVIEKMKPLGFLGAPIPTEYGGMGVDPVGYACIIEEIARADASVRSVVSVSCSLVALTILEWGSEEQRQQWLPALASGDVIGCFAMTEPGAGSDGSSIATLARRDDRGWVLDGSKIFITNGTVAGVALVFARTESSESGGLTCFIVPTDTPGFVATEIHGKLGLRASSTAEISLDGVRVDPTSVLGRPGEGMKIALAALDNGRVGIGASSVGIAQAALDASTKYAKEREQFGGPIAGHQLVQQMLADMYVRIEAARLLVWRAAAMKARGERNTLAASAAKYFASEAAVECTNLAIQVHGGYGYIDEFPVSRYMRDARASTLYEGTSQIQQLIIGRHLTGVNAFA